MIMSGMAHFCLRGGSVLRLGLTQESVRIQLEGGRWHERLLPPETPLWEGVARHLLSIYDQKVLQFGSASFTAALWVRDRQILAYRWHGSPQWYPLCCRHDVRLLLFHLTSGDQMEVETTGASGIAPVVSNASSRQFVSEPE